MVARRTGRPQAKLNERIVQQMINDRFERGMSYLEIGRKYGVNCSTVWLAVNGATWGHADLVMPPEAEQC